MDIHGPDFAVFMDLDLFPDGLSAARATIMPTIKDLRMVLLVDWLFASIEGTATGTQPEIPLTPADTLYRDALLSMISTRRRADEPSCLSRLHTLPVRMDFLSFTRSERVWSPIKLLNFFYRSHLEPKRGAAIVTSVRNEGINLVEWMAHHRALGFDEFFVYVNDSDDGTVELLTALAEQNICHVLVNETRLGATGESAFSIQAKAFEHSIHFLTPLRDFKWVLFSDVDEFLVTNPLIKDPSRDRPLDELIYRLDSDSNCPCGVLFNWKWFGGNSAYLREHGFNSERFRNFRGSGHLKTFARLSRCLRFSSSHLPHFVAGSCLLDGSLAPVAEPRIQMPETYEYGQINHYWNKSFEEFVAKRLRGRGFRSFDDFFAYGNNLSFGHFEALPETWIARVKAEFTALLSLPGVEDRHREADAKFRQLIREQEAGNELLDLYIKGRFGSDPASQKASEPQGLHSPNITITLGTAQAIERLPLLEGTERFAASWLVYWHSQAKIPPTDAARCHFIEDATVVGSGNIWIDGKPFSANCAPAQQVNLPIRNVSSPCMVMEGHGGGTYGRDILDWILRVWIARFAASERGLILRILLDFSAPPWVANLINVAAGIPPEDIEYYDPASERVLLHQAIVPSAPLGPAGYHSIVNRIVERILELRPKSPDASPRRLFLTQGAAQGTGARHCLNESELIDIATSRYGFTPVAIEAIGWLKQIELFRAAEIVLINSNRPMSSAIFCPAGGRIASIGFRELLLSQIGTLRGHRNAYFMFGTESSSRYFIAPKAFEEFVDAVCS